jgi:hypothetical protein
MTKKGQQMLTPAKIACSKLWIETPLLENGILARVETKEIFKYIKSKFVNLLMAIVKKSNDLENNAKSTFSVLLEFQSRIKLKSIEKLFSKLFKHFSIEFAPNNLKILSVNNKLQAISRFSENNVELHYFPEEISNLFSEKYKILKWCENKSSMKDFAQNDEFCQNFRYGPKFCKRYLKKVINGNHNASTVSSSSQSRQTLQKPIESVNETDVSLNSF